MKIYSRDLFTPANLITLIGLALTIFGATRLNTIAGLIVVIIGKAFDLLDGPIARRTHASQFGANMDTTADKLTGLTIIAAAYHFKLAPVLFLAYVFLQHFIVSVISVIAEFRGKHISVTQAGKHNMFLHVLALMLFILSSLTSSNISRPVYWIAVIIALASI